MKRTKEQFKVLTEEAKALKQEQASMTEGSQSKVAAKVTGARS